MTEQAKTEMSCREQGAGAPWYPWRKWWQSSWFFNQDVGLPPFLEPGDPRWKDVDRLQRSLAACSWLGYTTPTPLFVPYISESMHHPSQKISKWRVNMDVAHFFPSEISLNVRDGFLEVRGTHEERPDEHGFIARCFTRKYRLPAEVDVTKIMSTLSADGILTVEAPVPESSDPTAVCIPIKVEIDDAEEESESSKAPDHPENPSTGDHVENPPLEAQPGSTAEGLQQHEERKEPEEEEEEEENHEQPAGESHPSVPADDEATQSLHDSSEHHEKLENPDTDTTKLPGPDGGILVTGSSGEAATETTPPEEQDLGLQAEAQTQEQEAANMKQQHKE